MRLASCDKLLFYSIHEIIFGSFVLRFAVFCVLRELPLAIWRYLCLASNSVVRVSDGCKDSYRSISVGIFVVFFVLCSELARLSTLSPSSLAL